MSCSPSKLWGEIEESSSSSEDVFVPDITSDIERSMNKFCLAEFDTDYNEDSCSEENVNFSSMDPLMLYAISLHKYANYMSDMIRVAELAIESDLIPPADAVPPLPEAPQINIKHSKNYVDYVTNEIVPNVSDSKIENFEMSSMVAKQILSKSTATMLAHIGFETTHQSILDLLTDVLVEFINKIARSLMIAYEDEEKGNGNGFPNILERVLVELHMGGIQGLQDYYLTRVVKYIDTLQKRCRELNNHYESLILRKTPPPENQENKVIRVKVEEDDEVIEVENPQVHIAIDGEFSSLDAGYQLLNSLEAGASSSHGAPELEDETSITVSPSVVSIPEGEVGSTSLPFPKKKRLNK